MRDARRLTSDGRRKPGREVVRTRVMANAEMKDEHNLRRDDGGAPPVSAGSLLPMLVGGLVLIIVALIVVPMFV